MREFLFFLPLLAGSLWSAWNLFSGGPSGWDMLLALAGVLVLTLRLSSPARSPIQLALGGGSIVTAGLLLACCVYVSETAAERDALTEVWGTVVSVRTSAAKRVRPDRQIVLEDGETYWLSGVRWDGEALDLQPGDRIRILCTEKERSVYELEINGETVLDADAARVRTENNRFLLCLMVLLVLPGLGLSFLSRAGKRPRRTGPQRRRNRR